MSGRHVGQGQQFGPHGRKTNVILQKTGGHTELREKIIMVTIAIVLGLVAVGGIFASFRNFGKRAQIQLIKLDIV